VTIAADLLDALTALESAGVALRGGRTPGHGRRGCKDKERDEGEELGQDGEHFA